MRFLVSIPLVLAAWSLTPVEVSPNPCLSNVDTADFHADQIARIVTQTDSLDLSALGIPYKPSSGVSIVSDSATCQGLVAAYNARLSGQDTTKRIDRAYAFRVGTTAYSIVSEHESITDAIYVFFNNAYVWLTSVIPPD
jgi:hypothetical protein